ncbi:hypothetical protein V1520DRAFT_783 [Lipomyces starkeyi]|uniref:BZIP domain-containing protein n=1 Tax=Lipomyces starkeyi NRRL Y-11557 TaxID=675824 RepID=A0A1E3QB59_LIPST|nr:hypothetical protein LIPSTDRAFT_62402 [Lipomyces starkeyi NRRL Y-11557]
MSCSTTAINPASVTLSVGPQATKGKEAISNADHLARIRENQRRSRARKREYVADLETKIRSCQEEGLQLNIQIQRTARRVVDENRKLRELLSKVGVDERMVEDWLRNKESGEYEIGLARRKEEEDILKAKHPCIACGTAPAKKVKDDRSPASSQIPVAPAASSPITTASLLPRNVSIATAPVVDTSALISANSATYHRQVPISPIGVPIIEPKAAQLHSSSQQQVIPIDFTAYFQSGDIDAMTMPLPYYEQPHPVPTYSATPISPVADSSAGSCCGSSTSGTPSQVNDNGITIHPPVGMESYDNRSLADQLEHSISNLETYESLRKEKSYKLDLVQISIKLWEGFVRASAAANGGNTDALASRIDTRHLMSVLDEIIES